MCEKAEYFLLSLPRSHIIFLRTNTDFLRRTHVKKGFPIVSSDIQTKVGVMVARDEIELPSVVWLEFRRGCRQLSMVLEQAVQVHFQSLFSAIIGIPNASSHFFGLWHESLSPLSL